jgi:hypothetical protein
LPAGAGGDAGDADPQYRRFGGSTVGLSAIARAWR